MTAAHASPAVIRAAVGAACLVGLVVVILILTSGGSAHRIPGMPAPVAAALGPDPVTLTLHGNALALGSAPDVQRLAGLEAQIARQPYVQKEYGLVDWLNGQIATIRASVKAHTTARETRADLLVRAGASGGLTLSDSVLTSTLMFGTGVDPVAGVRWLIPTGNAVRIFVRTKGSRSRAAVGRALVQLVDQSGLIAQPSVGTAG